MELRARRRYKMTLEDHIELGRTIQDAIAAIGKVVNLVSRFELCYAKDLDRLIALFNGSILNQIRCHAEDEMFRDYPFVNNTALNVYYGSGEKVTIEDIVSRKEKK